ncbi:MAG: hypothetical protein A2X67_02415 [Ignavibacteria bacterium GWA2_55_11]|nr:MAG: hypothetical protein A2X67_02415 [Ignavibacteria bacterium GWA2_55_11]OGU43295.1 MAG: hypothetical protein A2X68_13020 [Ignavibacteria bacterium GWC2_56_12]
MSGISNIKIEVNFMGIERKEVGECIVVGAKLGKRPARCNAAKTKRRITPALHQTTKRRGEFGFFVIARPAIN